MQLYRSLLICALISFCGTFTTTTVVAATQIDQRSESMNGEVRKSPRYLRTFEDQHHVPAATTNSANDEATTPEEIRSRQIQNVINDPYGNSYYLDDYFASTCDGFKYELDDNGFCKLSSGYVALMVFVNIAIVVAIVIASCACCKCCIWYPYLCCASDSERLPQVNAQHRNNGNVTTAAYTGVKKIKPTNIQATEVNKTTNNTGKRAPEYDC